jgi:hypothetical protein
MLIVSMGDANLQDIDFEKSDIAEQIMREIDHIARCFRIKRDYTFTPLLSSFMHQCPGIQSTCR